MARLFRSVASVGAILATGFGASGLGCLTGSDAVPGPGDEPLDGSLADETSSDGGGSDGGGIDGAPSPYPLCADPHPLIVEGKDTGFVRCANGALHRTRIADCPVVARDAGIRCEQPQSPGLACQQDSDCTSAPLGRCDTSCKCSYGCVRDSDCPATTLCACAEGGGSCAPTTCATDALCPSGSLCADDFAIAGCSTSRPFSCQSPADECLGADGCPHADGGGPTCVIGDGGIRVCSDLAAQCPGRPFLVEGRARVATLTRTDGWLTDRFGPELSRLTARARQELGAYYDRVAQMEHASVAAFARFALDLLALGAPSDLIVRTTKAMADETEHARLAFSLASAYAGASRGPDRLAMDGALEPCTPERVFATLVREGCIGETLAAVEAAEALARATDPSVRAVLARIAEDEAQHALLAWQSARWLLARSDASFRAWASDEIARAVAERRALSTASVRSTADLEAHGMLDAITMRALAEATLRDIVVPCAQTLREEVGAERDDLSCWSSLLRT